MKLFATTIIFLASLSANAQSNDAKNGFAKGLKNAICDATTYSKLLPQKTAKAEISLDVTDAENPLVTVKSKEKELNFKIGQLNYNGRIHDTSMVCELGYNATDDYQNVLSYVCLYKHESTALDAYEKDTLSAKLFSTADGSRFTTICKGDITGSSRGCYGLTNCQ